MTSHNGPELIRDAKGNPVIDCEDCGFAHLWPKPSPGELAKFYAESFYESGPSDWHEKEAREEPYWRIEFSDRVATLAEILKKRTGKLLDIGCGGGWFLSYAAAQGWDVLGIEPSQSTWRLAVTRAPVLLGTFPEVDVSRKAPFDAVHLKLVMEHVSDAHAVFRAVHEVLRPGGAIVVQSPNDFNPLQLAARRLLDKDPWWVVHPVHINYFNFDSLERTLYRCGFEPCLREATFPMEWFLLQGIDYIGRDDIGRKCHGQRMALEQSLEAAGLTHLRLGFSRWLASQGIGREAVIYAVRK